MVQFLARATVAEIVVKVHCSNSSNKEKMKNYGVEIWTIVIVSLIMTRI